MMSKLQAGEYKLFEDVKQIRADGSEYWSARELAPVLEYTEWRNFSKVIDRAMVACETSGYKVFDHFVEVNKMIALAKGAKREVFDYELSRYACYLIVQNGDLRKEVIALGQTVLDKIRWYVNTGVGYRRCPINSAQSDYRGCVSQAGLCGAPRKWVAENSREQNSFWSFAPNREQGMKCSDLSEL